MSSNDSNACGSLAWPLQRSVLLDMELESVLLVVQDCPWVLANVLSRENMFLYLEDRRRHCRRAGSEIFSRNKTIGYAGTRHFYI